MQILIDVSTHIQIQSKLLTSTITTNIILDFVQLEDTNLSGMNKIM